MGEVRKPIALEFACIMYRMVEGDINRESIIWCTREREDKDSRVTDNLSGLGVSATRLG